MITVQSHAGRLGRWVHTPESWDEASAVLAEHPFDGAVSGGATYLMWRAAHGEPMPDHLISLHRIPGFDDVTDGSVGALASLRKVERGPMNGPQRALTMAASVTAGPAVRTLATLGGNLASGFPQADLVPALLALDVTVHLTEGRQVAVRDVVDKGLLTTDLVTRVTHNLRAEDGWTGATVKLSRRGMDLPIATASAVLRVADEEVIDAHVAVGSLFDRPTRLAAIEAALVGADTSDETMRELLGVVGITGRHFVDDEEASGAYRSKVAVAVVRRALTTALDLGSDGLPAVGAARA